MDESEQTYLQQQIRAALESTGRSVRGLALDAGLKPDAIRDILRGKSSTPQSDTVNALAKHLNRTVESLLGPSNDVERSIIRVGAQSEQGRVEGTPKGYALAREYDAEAAGGNGTFPNFENDDGPEVLAEWLIPRNFLPAERRASTIAIMRVRGRSMSPTLNHGERVMVDISQTWVEDEAIYVAWNGSGVVIKNCMNVPGPPPSVRFTSENPSFGEFTLPSEEVRVFGRVIGKWLWM